MGSYTDLEMSDIDPKSDYNVEMTEEGDVKLVVE
jgi:hypothetical protein